MNKKASHEVELNFYYLHYRDAQKFIEWAKAEPSKLKSLFVRHAILSTVFASEALINRILNDFSILKSGEKTIEKLTIVDKWCLAPLICRTANQEIKTFDASEEPLQSFSELIKIRNWLAHPKPGEYIYATTDGVSTIILDTDAEVPWVETIKGKTWPQTKIPFNPFELTSGHAEKALKIFDSMLNKLKEFLSDKINETWLSEINFVSKDKSDAQKITTNSLWGGYTPD